MMAHDSKRYRPDGGIPEGGPDFRHAEILLEGKGTYKGRCRDSCVCFGLMKHQHDKQDTYNTVCLHVVMWNDREGVCVKNLMRQSIPQLTLSKYLDAELDDLVDMIDTESYPKGGER